MRRQQRMGVGVRLGLGFALIIALTIVTAVVGNVAIRQFESGIQYLLEDRVPKKDQVALIKNDAHTQARAVRNIVLIDDPRDREREHDVLLAARTHAQEILDVLEASLDTDRGRELVAQGTEARGIYYKSVDEAVELAFMGAPDRARNLLIASTLRQQQQNFFDSLDELGVWQDTLMDRAVTDLEATTTKMQWIMLIIVLGAVLISSVIGWYLVRSITRQLGGEPDYAAAIVGEIAAGNLATTVQTRSNDSTSLIASMKTMQQSLVEVVGKVRQDSENVATASGQISQGNQDLASRTTEQAAAIQEVAASMEELNATVRQNADNANQADTLAKMATDIAVKGGEVVASVVETMEGIDESSQKMLDIINVIDGIAFQTNILALNAAVEAARAGEQGRGFAVVASEVRALAQRSAASAREIQELISDSAERVARGTSQVTEAGDTMHEIVDSIRKVTDIMGEISTASTEQSEGVGQIGVAVTQMEETTQQNAALVEQMSAAAGSLNQQASDLVQAVAVFNINGFETGTMISIKDITPPAATQPPQGIATGTRHLTGDNIKSPALTGRKPDEEDEWQTF